MQVFTGYILASNYVATEFESFHVIHNIIMRELDTGWLLRFYHMNGCGFLFLMMYLHIVRSIFLFSFTLTSVWIVGIIMYILLCAIAFTGYSLVYGQMSLWAIVVICSLVTAVPLVGTKLLLLIFGGNLVSSVTLQRISSGHYILPLLLIILIMIHLYNLHNVNSTGDQYFLDSRYDRTSFYPLLLFRDAFIGSALFLLMNILVYYYSDLFGHPDNYVPANPLVTPAEIMPEFYLLPFYALIRAIPHKVYGIITLVNFLGSFTTGSYLSSFSFLFILHRALFLLVFLDISIASFLCLLMNHFSSFYFLLLFHISFILFSYSTF